LPNDLNFVELMHPAQAVLDVSHSFK